MKRTIFISVFALIGTIAYSQSYSDFFSTYTGTSTQSTQQGQSNGVLGPEILEKLKPQNVRTVNGVYIHNGQLYSVKLKVGDKPNSRDELIGCGYWDGHSWNNITFYPSSIGIGARIPEQIKLACTHEAYISSLGTVYF